MTRGWLLENTGQTILDPSVSRPGFNMLVLGVRGNVVDAQVCGCATALGVLSLMSEWILVVCSPTSSGRTGVLSPLVIECLAIYIYIYIWLLQ